MVPLVRTTTLLVPAPTYDLVALATVKDELGIPSSNTDNDDFLTRAITNASGAISRYCNRNSAVASEASFPVETVADLFYPARDPYPWQFPNLMSPLQLSHWPVASFLQLNTTEDTSSGASSMNLPGLVGMTNGSTVIIAPGMAVGGAYPMVPPSSLPPYSGNQNIAVGSTVSSATNATVTLSAPVTEDIPAGTILTIGGQTVTTQADMPSSDATVEISSDAGLEIGQPVSSATAGIPGGATVAGFADAAIGLSAPTTGDIPAGTQITVGLAVTQTDPPGMQELLVAGLDFVIDAQRGQLTRLDYFTAYPMAWPSVQMTIGYSGGFPTIPPDVQDAALRWIVMRWGNRKRDPSIRSQVQPGLGQVTFFTGPPTFVGGVPEDIAQLLGPYRVPVTA